jgi:hypothetical protein
VRDERDPGADAEGRRRLPLHGLDVDVPPGRVVGVPGVGRDLYFDAPSADRHHW